MQSGKSLTVILGKGICKKIGVPVIIKPAVSGGSMGVSVKNVVNTDNELEKE